MKPWIWLVLFLLTVAGGVFIAKRGSYPETPSSVQGVPAPVVNAVPGPGMVPSTKSPPLPRTGDSYRPTVPMGPEGFRQAPGGGPENFSPPPISEPPSEMGSGQYPDSIPSPPPMPNYPPPEGEPLPEYYDGEVPQPFEPPPPLDDNEGFVPQLPPDSGAEL